jgi:hypothetical protein
MAAISNSIEGLLPLLQYRRTRFRGMTTRGKQ